MSFSVVVFLSMFVSRRPLTSTLFPYTTLFRSLLRPLPPSAFSPAAPRAPAPRPPPSRWARARSRSLRLQRRQAAVHAVEAGGLQEPAAGGHQLLELHPDLREQRVLDPAVEGERLAVVPGGAHRVRQGHRGIGDPLGGTSGIAPAASAAGDAERLPAMQERILGLAPQQLRLRQRRVGARCHRQAPGVMGVLDRAMEPLEALLVARIAQRA